jgi:hypothetical protein
LIRYGRNVDDKTDHERKGRTVSEDEKNRPSFLLRFLVTTACPVALALVAARGSLEPLAATFLLAALVCGAIAAALTRSWPGSIAGSVLAAMVLVFFFFVAVRAGCSHTNGDCF